MADSDNRLDRFFPSLAAGLTPPPDGWWRELSDEAIQYLGDLGRERTIAVADERDRQERKAVVLMAWVLALISASGLLGDLELGRNAVGIASWSALGLTGAIVAAATFVFWPRDWGKGVNLAWLAQRASIGPRSLRGEELDALVVSYCVNIRLLRLRSPAVDAMTLLLPVQALAVILVQVFAGGETISPGG